MTAAGPPTSSVEVRARLVEALRLDLVGPGPGDEHLAREALPGWVRPSTWYLTGFLIPSGTPPERAADADEDEGLGQVQRSPGEPGESTDDGRAARRGLFPSSMGLSFLVPEAQRSLELTISWGDYVPGVTQEQDQWRDPPPDRDKPPDWDQAPAEATARDQPRDQLPGQAQGPEHQPLIAVWRRNPRSVALSVPLPGDSGPAVRNVPGSDGLQVVVDERPVALDALASYLPAGARSVSVFLVNNRSAERVDPDRAYAFQAELRVQASLPFVPRPDLQGSGAEEWDDLVADLHYADAPEYATGHGVSAGWEVAGGECRTIFTRWLPAAEVAKTATVDLPAVELSMDALGALEPGGAGPALQPLTASYRSWIAAQRATTGRLQGRRQETADQLLGLADAAARRIEDGITLLDDEADVLDAFRMANRCVARALRQRLHTERPTWRAFQLAFLLLNLPGLADPGDPERDMVD
ncbi:MAG: hypothetical protein ACRDJU_04785, partial [Actinomycetota bacterium]